MRIGLIDVDGHRFPSIPLMKLSAWHKAQGDAVEWYSPWSALTGTHYDRVYKSKVFTFTQDYDHPIYADEVVKGGSGYCIELVDGKEVYHTEKDKPLPYEVEHAFPDYSLYPELTGYGKPLKDQVAYGYLTRGCPRNCTFCHTTQKDGRRSHKVADLSEFWNGQQKIILLDQNILACPDRMELLDQLIASGVKVEFNGGLDIRLINDDVIEKVKQLRLHMVHFAFDRYQDKDIIEPRLRRFCERTGYNRERRVMVYILCNYDSTIEQDISRIQFCRELRISPYPMIYDKEHADPIYKQLQRWCSNFIFWKCPTFEEYRKGVKK